MSQRQPPIALTDRSPPGVARVLRQLADAAPGADSGRFRKAALVLDPEASRGRGRPGEMDDAALAVMTAWLAARAAAGEPASDRAAARHAVEALGIAGHSREAVEERLRRKLRDARRGVVDAWDKNAPPIFVPSEGARSGVEPKLRLVPKGNENGGASDGEAD